MTAETINHPEKTKVVHPLRVRDFRLLFAGQSISLLGDQFYLIALPWLVLQITGSALALGTVLAVASVPRALFMLVGGALVDRFSPRNVMFVSNAVRMILVALLALVVLTGNIQLWMLYVLALGFGTADAFFFPADNAMVPRLLEKDQLEMGNTLTQGVGMLSMFLGPVLAGGIIALLAGSSSGAEAAAPSFTGIGIAFALDAFSFLVSLVTLSRIGAHKPALSEAQEKTSVLASIKEGIAYVWSDTALRMVFLVMVATNFVVNGPFEVGIPVLAKRNFVEGAAAYGIIVSAFGGGALLGVILASALPRPRPSRFGSVLLGVTSLLGIGMIALPFSATIPAAAIISLAMGIVMGYVNIHIFTWMQKRVPEQFMGRTMSLAMFAAMGLAPVSSALAGAVINVNLTLLFVVAGAFMTLVTFGSTLRHEVRDMGLGVIEPAPTAPTDTTTRSTDEIPAVRRTDTIPAVHL